MPDTPGHILPDLYLDSISMWAGNTVHRVKLLIILSVSSQKQAQCNGLGHFLYKFTWAGTQNDQERPLMSHDNQMILTMVIAVLAGSGYNVIKEVIP